jgi:tetratricopeptide (TPR) repeat protein
MKARTSGRKLIPAFVGVLALVAGVVSVAGILYETSSQEGGQPQSLSGTWLRSSETAIAREGYERLLAGKLEGPGGAVEAFETALRRDMASPYRWCDLGEAWLAAGGIEKAEYCVNRALELGPNSPPVLIRAANFHFRTGEPRRALPYTARVLRMVGEYDETIFSSYDRMGVTQEEVLRAGLPNSERAAQSYFRHLIAKGSTEQVQAGWHWVESRSFADDQLADEYAGYLLRSRQYDTAAGAWAAYTTSREPGYRASNWLFNGGFEREPAGAIFDWRITPAEGVQASRDSGKAASGQWSLRVRFEGKENVSYHHVSQMAVVEPGMYRFRAQVQTEAITTDEGVGFRIVDAEDPQRLEITTERLVGTQPWREVEQAFRVPERTRLLEIQIWRKPSLKFDNKISGTVWVDAAVLERVASSGSHFVVQGRDGRRRQ